MIQDMQYDSKNSNEKANGLCLIIISWKYINIL